MKFVIEIEPKPQSRPRFARAGRGVRTYETGEMTAYKKLVAQSIRKQMDKGMLLNGHIELYTTFYITPPNYIKNVKKNAVALKNEQIKVNKKPDIDNYVKAVMDNLVYKDDGMICKLTAEKRYSLNPRIEIEIREELT